MSILGEVVSGAERGNVALWVHLCYSSCLIMVHIVVLRFDFPSWAMMMGIGGVSFLRTVILILFIGGGLFLKGNSPAEYMCSGIKLALGIIVSVGAAVAVEYMPMRLAVDSVDRHSSLGSLQLGLLIGVLRTSTYLVQLYVAGSLFVASLRLPWFTVYRLFFIASSAFSTVVMTPILIMHPPGLAFFIYVVVWMFDLATNSASAVCLLSKRPAMVCVAFRLLHMFPTGFILPPEAILPLQQRQHRSRASQQRAPAGSVARLRSGATTDASSSAGAGRPRGAVDGAPDPSSGGSALPREAVERAAVTSDGRGEHPRDAVGGTAVPSDGHGGPPKHVAAGASAHPHGSSPTPPDPGPVPEVELSSPLPGTSGILDEGGPLTAAAAVRTDAALDGGSPAMHPGRHSLGRKSRSESAPDTQTDSVASFPLDPDVTTLRADLASSAAADPLGADNSDFLVIQGHPDVEEGAPESVVVSSGPRPIAWTDDSPRSRPTSRSKDGDFDDDGLSLPDIPRETVSETPHSRSVAASRMGMVQRESRVGTIDDSTTDVTSAGDDVPAPSHPRLRSTAEADRDSSAPEDRIRCCFWTLPVRRHTILKRYTFLISRHRTGAMYIQLGSLASSHLIGAWLAPAAGGAVARILSKRSTVPLGIPSDTGPLVLMAIVLFGVHILMDLLRIFLVFFVMRWASQMRAGYSFGYAPAAVMSGPATAVTIVSALGTAAMAGTVLWVSDA